MAMVNRMIDAGKTEIILAFRFLVAVQQRLFFAAIARCAEIMWLFAASDEQRAISKRAILHRYG
ncbi:hypothetical protein D3C87_2140820 [compost metagenome]